MLLKIDILEKKYYFHKHFNVNIVRLYNKYSSNLYNKKCLKDRIILYIFVCMKDAKYLCRLYELPFQKADSLTQVSKKPLNALFRPVCQ